MITLDSLNGRELEFFGACDNCFKLGDHVFEAIEDEDDGYRSHLKDICEVTDAQKLKNLIFSPTAIAIVKLIPCDGTFDGWEVHDALIEFKWGTVGTDHADDYYPCFRCYFDAVDPLEEYRMIGGGVITGNDYVRLRDIKLGLITVPAGVEPFPAHNSKNPLWGAWG